MFQSTPTGFPAGDAPSWPATRWTSRFQSTPTGFPAGDTFEETTDARAGEFQSTPTGFPAGDRAILSQLLRTTSFNPRRPVSRPATEPAEQLAHEPAVSIHADRFPGRRHQRGLEMTPDAPVSIHADRFPGRRPRWLSGCAARAWFQSTPTGFPAGDCVRVSCDRGLCCFNPRRPVSRPATYEMTDTVFDAQVSIHADRFPGRRPAGFGAALAAEHVSIHADRFPGRRHPWHRTAPDTPRVSIHADRFPGRRHQSLYSRPKPEMFQSTPTGFPAGDGLGLEYKDW